MKYLARIAVVAGAVFALLAATAADAARKPKDILQYIPEDTPYVMAFVKPFPDDLIDKMEPAIEETLAAYRSILEFAMEEAAAEAAEQSDAEAPLSAEQRAQFEALADELIAILSAEGLEGAGIGRDSLFAIYGDGLLPVMRLALSDGEKFAATIARFEEKAEQKFDVADLGGVSYRYKDFDEKIRLIIATPGDDVVVAVVPIAYAEERLVQTLGVKKPRKSLYRSKVLREISKEYDFTDHLVSFFDVERIASSFLGDPSGLNAELLALAEYDASQLDETCRNEFMEMAGIAPRVVIGYTGVDEDRLDARMVVEVREDIARGLTTLPAAVPGLGPDLGGLFTFGFSLDPMALRNFYEARLDAMEADPYECAALAELQASTEKGRAALAQPIPPIAYSFRGILANVTDITGFDLATEKPPESIDGSILFAMENAQDVVNMAALMSPQIAALNLMPDGKAKLMDLPELAELGQQVFAALGGNGLAMSVGDNADKNAESMLTAQVTSPSPLMTFSMDAKRYYEFVGNAVMQADETEEGEEPMPEEVKKAVRDIMTASGSVYERMSTNVLLTKRGIEVESSIKLVD